MYYGKFHQFKVHVGGCVWITHSNTRHPKPRQLRHENQPGLPDFSACNSENNGEALVRGYKNTSAAIVYKDCSYRI